MTKITFPGGAGGGGGGGVSDHGGLTGLGDDDHTQYLLRADFASSGAAQKPTTSGTVVGAGTQMYVSGIAVGDFMSAHPVSTAEGLAIDGSNRMTGTLNGPTGSTFEILGAANVGSDFSDDMATFDTALWSNVTQGTAGTALSHPGTVLRWTGNSNGGTSTVGRKSNGVLSKDAVIVMQFDVTNIGEFGFDSNLIFGLMPNSYSPATTDFGEFTASTGSMVNNANSMTVSVEADNNNLDVNGSVTSSNVTQTSHPEIDPGDFNASGMTLSLRLTYNATEGSGTVDWRDSNMAADTWIEVETGAITPAEDFRIFFGCYEAGNMSSLTFDLDQVTQTSGNAALDGAVTTVVEIDSVATIADQAKLVDFKRANTNVASIYGDGSYAGPSGVFSSQVSISGIDVGDFPSAAAVDARPATGDINPDTDDTYSIGNVTVAWNDIHATSGHFASGIIMAAPNGSGWRLSLDNAGILQTDGPFVLG